MNIQNFLALSEYLHTGFKFQTIAGPPIQLLLGLKVLQYFLQVHKRSVISYIFQIICNTLWRVEQNYQTWAQFITNILSFRCDAANSAIAASSFSLLASNLQYLSNSM